MKIKFTLVGGLVALLLNTTSLYSCGMTPLDYAQRVLSTNDVAASNAVVALRGLGRDGLNALLDTHQQLIANHNDRDPQWQRLRAALDAVGGQRDCYASHLFWHTNFDNARAEAQKTGKPILSLRLLGNLDEELSCANSRFFRTTLYSNKEVSDYLREHFVLHWKSVRPVPRITIDMGDGRRIERTITGNSIHYVLDANGEVIDALPGLYGPRAFLAGLRDVELTALRPATANPAMRAQFIQSFHTARLAEINRRWGRELSSVLPAEDLAPKTVTLSNGTTLVQFHPAAEAAMPLAISKSGLERPMLRALLPARDGLEHAMTDETWAKIAALHQDDVALDSNSIALIRAKTLAGDAMRITKSKRVVEDPMLKTIQNLRRSIAEDTVRNEYLFHSKIHAWLAAPGATPEIEALNRRVYAELFLTPESDPWLGLVPQNTFSALENDGLVQNAGVPKSNPR